MVLSDEVEAPIYTNPRFKSSITNTKLEQTNH